LTERQVSVRQSREFPQKIGSDLRRSRDSSNAHMLLFSENQVLNYIQEEDNLSMVNRAEGTSKKSVFEKLYYEHVTLDQKKKEQRSQLKLDDNELA